MTDYLKPRFTLPAGPAADVPWPFERRPAQPDPCLECGRPCVRNAKQNTVVGHIDQRDEDEKRSRKRVCFGKVVAR